MVIHSRSPETDPLPLNPNLEPCDADGFASDQVDSCKARGLGVSEHPQVFDL